jgi:hypothetical protein
MLSDHLFKVSLQDGFVRALSAGEIRGPFTFCANSEGGIVPLIFRSELPEKSDSRQWQAIYQ